MPTLKDSYIDGAGDAISWDNTTLNLMGQQFVAGSSYYLSKISIPMKADTGAYDNAITMTLRTLTIGTSGSTTLATSTTTHYSKSELTTSYVWYDWLFPATALTNGVTYSIVVSTGINYAGLYIRWQGATSDVYTGQPFYLSNVYPNNWIAIANKDANFKIYSDLESMSITDSLSISPSIVKNIKKYYSSAIVLNSSVTRLSTLKRVFEDTIELIGSLSALSEHWAFRMLSETIDITDTMIKAIDLHITILDTATISEVATKLVSRVKSDVITLTDSITRIVYKILSSTITISSTLYKSIYRLLSSIVSLTGTVDRKFMKSFSDTVSFAETRLMSVWKTLISTINIGSVLIKYKYMTALSDTITLVSTLIKQYTFAREVDMRLSVDQYIDMVITLEGGGDL